MEEYEKLDNIIKAYVDKDVQEFSINTIKGSPIIGIISYFTNDSFIVPTLLTFGIGMGIGITNKLIAGNRAQIDYNLNNNEYKIYNNKKLEGKVK